MNRQLEELLHAAEYAKRKLEATIGFIEANPHIRELTAIWDEAECDGGCLQDECETASDMLHEAIDRIKDAAK